MGKDEVKTLNPKVEPEPDKSSSDGKRTPPARQSEEYLKTFDNLMRWERVLAYLQMTPKATIAQLTRELAAKDATILQGFVFSRAVSIEGQMDIWMRWARKRVIRQVKKWQREGKALIGTVSEPTEDQKRALNLENGVGHPYLIYLPGAQP